MAKNTNVEKLCDRELLEKILSIVERQEKLPPPAQEGGHCLYDNKSLMEKLHIKEKYLKKLRDNGYLGYSREGDQILVHAGGCRPLPASFPLRGVCLRHHAVRSGRRFSCMTGCN